MPGIKEEKVNTRNCSIMCQFITFGMWQCRIFFSWTWECSSYDEFLGSKGITNTSQLGLSHKTRQQSSLNDRRSKIAKKMNLGRWNTSCERCYRATSSFRCPPVFVVFIVIVVVVITSPPPPSLPFSFSPPIVVINVVLIIEHARIRLVFILCGTKCCKKSLSGINPTGL